MFESAKTTTRDPEDSNVESDSKKGCNLEKNGLIHVNAYDIPSICSSVKLYRGICVIAMISCLSA